ncbi:MAG: hypothetical protein ACI9J3_002117 [Parvicellaceae bacterium]|jgi:hypothetical protein
MQLKRSIVRISILIFFFGSTAYAQNNVKVAKEGTFQLITSNPKIQEVFTNSILITIEENRKESTVEYYKLSEYTQVKIFPYNVINAPGFKPSTELYTDK